MEVWFTSDTHAWHKNITSGVSDWSDKSVCRQFDNEYDMTDQLVTNINRLVMPNDTLYHLGDWSFGGFANILKFRELINCRNIHLLIGNHDHHILMNKNNCRNYFSSVNIDFFGNISGQTFHMYHAPLASWYEMRRGSINLFGHCHGSYKTNGKQMDVGVDTNNMLPYHIDQIVNLMKLVDIVKVDHHA